MAVVFVFSVIGLCFHGWFVFHTKLQTWLSLCAITVSYLRDMVKPCLVSTTCLTQGLLLYLKITILAVNKNILSSSIHYKYITQDLS